LIGAVAERGSCDIVRDLAVPLPVITIIELIGFDRTHWEDLARWSETTNSAGAGPAYFHDGVMQAVEGFMELSAQTLEARRAEPRDDALSAMLAAQRSDVPRSEGEIHMEALLLLNGGSDTTRHVIAGATLALLQHPEQCTLLRRDPARITIAVEEFIRWVTPILNMRRTATFDTDLCGETIRKGDEVLLMYASANRDETMFVDPERFDVTRHPNPHIAFGFGTHFCLGASLARLELRVVFEELLRRLPDLRLADGFEPRWVPNAFTRGLEALRVEFSPVRASD
jgi:cytochrome P450 family 142 subfamily A polypeptide 1